MHSKNIDFTFQQLSSRLNPENHVQQKNIRLNSLKNQPFGLGVNDSLHKKGLTGTECGFTMHPVKGADEATWPRQPLPTESFRMVERKRRGAVNSAS